MAHGHELRGGLLEEMGATRWRRAQGEKWDKYNSIINKIYFKKNHLQFTIFSVQL